MSVAKGDTVLAARILGIDRKWLRERINTNDKLRALWGHCTDPGGPPVPTPRDVMGRDPLMLPEVKQPNEIELVDLLSKADYDMHRSRLRKLGLPDSVLERIKELEKLAPSTGHMIALSLEIGHRDYHVTGLQLTAMLDGLWRRLMAKKGDPDHIADSEERAFLMKVYIDGVKERGNFFKIMLTAGEAMVKMMDGVAHVGEGPATKKKKPGWDIKTVAKTPMSPPPS